MKLVFLIDSTRNIGGGDYAQFVFAHKLSQKGHDVTIFSGDRNFYSEELDASDVKTFYRRTIPLVVKKIGLGLLNRLWNKLYTKLCIDPHIKKHEPDFIIGYLRESAIKAQRIGEKYDIQVVNFVFENPDWMEEDLGDIWREEWSISSFRNSWLATKEAYRHSNMLIPNSKLSAKKMKEWIPEANISLPVYPGVHIPNIKQVPRDIDIIYIGRLNKLKNVQDILLAAEPTWNITIVGKGNEEENLKSLAAQRKLQVNFAGKVSDEEKWNLLARSKVLVFPTSHEGFGMPPLEALASGCNIVVSDIPILHEVYGKEGTYVKLHDIKGLKKEIKKSLKKPPAKTKLDKKYTWDKATSRIEKILRGMQ